MTPTTGVPEILARTREAIAPAMVAAVDRLDPDTRLQVSYHLGWTDAEGRQLSAPTGKGIRPALALLSAAAAWSDPSVGIPGAVAVELIHNFSLIHDDIIDGDTERHHRPTVWSVFGVGSAIITGDALQTLAHQALLEAPESRGAAASVALAEGTAAMIAGQAMDVAFEKRRNVSVEECMAMCAAKTGALLGCAASIGAVLAGAPPATVGALRDFGGQLGLAFQAVDDLLGIWGDPATTGKPAGNDLRQRKKSMPVVAALAAGGEDADELRELVLGPAPDRVSHLVGAIRDGDSPAPAPAAGDGGGQEPLSPEQVARATLLVERCGGREWTQVRAKAHLDAALGALQRVRLSAIPHRELADLAVFVVERES
ncbi:MAG: polyprenyl synthetase family protein [Acidimicrobiaceae bacterium]|nr:polyprenyl synthetase family protein [Acidimicrobiaceae bacterium]MBO0747568.1 polyprenyl synthetase family protein [Acidimicrobiaceae bacterium]